MTTYNTGNPIGSTDARDRLDNSENMDILENSTTLNEHPDRLGTMRKTRKGMELEHDNQISAHEAEHDNQMQSFEDDFDSRLAGMAFTRVGTFTTGATLTDMRQTLLWEVSQGGDGYEYGWSGAFSKVVPPSSTPATSGGVGAGAWIDRTQDTLRSELQNFIDSSGHVYNESELDAASIANDPAIKTQILAAINRLSKLNVQSGAATFATDTGAANAYVVSLTPALVAPRGEGMVIRVKVANTNTGACTVNDGVSTVPIVGLALSALQGGEMAAGGTAWIQWHPSVGTGSYVLLYCSGAPLQVANSIKSQHAVALGQLTSVVGSARNLKCSVTAASATATFTADELIVETVLGGLKYQITSLNKSINLSATGAGGIDTGAAPTSGFVAIYAILNPTTGSTALLGVNATSVAAPEVYGGSNMPSGYTASALISVLPTNSSGLFTVAHQQDRFVHIASSSVVTTSSAGTNVSVNVSSIIPKNAKTISGTLSAAVTTGSGAVNMIIASDSTSVTSRDHWAYSANSTPTKTNYSELPILTVQNMWYSANANGGTAWSWQVSINGYSF